MIDKEKILEQTNRGLAVFEWFIPEFRKLGKPFKSPFREEKTPSANIALDPKSNTYFYKDFGSDETYFPIDFIVKYKGCDFKQALEIAAGLGGVYIEKPTTKSKVVEIIYPDQNKALEALKIQTSNFHIYCNTLKIDASYLQRWNCGTKQIKDKLYTLFIYKDSNGFFLNVKHVLYNENGNRLKDANPFYLTSKEQNSKYSLCLFGEHLLRNDNNIIVCVVESEKTAVIASHVYPQFDWVATGGKSIGDGKRLDILKHRKVYILTDADPKINKDGKANERFPQAAKYCKENNIDFSIIDLFPEREDGYDIADAIRDNTKPEIKPFDNIKDGTKRQNNIHNKVEDWLTERYELRRNIVSNSIEGKNLKTGESYTVNEHNIHRELQHENIQFSTAKICSLLASNFVPDYDPFLDYFETLPEWDKETDYISQLANYVKAKDQEFFNINFKKMLVRTIACWLDSKYFNKHCFVLVHAQQSSGKSTFLRFLCPTGWEEKYYTDTFIVGKDGEMALSDNGFINLDELALLSRQDINSIKTVLSRLNIRQRRPFERNITTAPRRASFVASTNKTEFLTDETGSVRWLCFEIERIVWDYIKEVNIDMVWSQAYYLLKNGFKHELTAEELQKSEENNQAYQVTTQEMETIANTYEKTDSEEFFKTATDILYELQGSYGGMKLYPSNVGKALKFYGYKYISKRVDGMPRKGWLVKRKL